MAQQSSVERAKAYTRSRLAGVHRVFGDARSGNIATGKYSDIGATSYVAGEGYYRRGKLIAPDDQIKPEPPKPEPKQTPRPEVNLTSQSGMKQPQSRRAGFYETLEAGNRTPVKPTTPPPKTFRDDRLRYADVIDRPQRVPQFPTAENTRVNIGDQTKGQGTITNVKESVNPFFLEQNKPTVQGSTPSAFTKAKRKVDVALYEPDRSRRIARDIAIMGLGGAALGSASVAARSALGAAKASKSLFLLDTAEKAAGLYFGAETTTTALTSEDRVRDLTPAAFGIAGFAGGAQSRFLDTSIRTPAKIAEPTGNTQFQTIVSRRPLQTESSFFTGQRTLTGDFAKPVSKPTVIGQRQIITAKPTEIGLTAQTQTIPVETRILGRGNQRISIEGFDSSGIFTGSRTVGGRQARLQPELIQATELSTGRPVRFRPEDIKSNEAGTFFRSEPQSNRFRLSEEFDQFRTVGDRTRLFNEQVKTTNPSEVKIKSDMFTKAPKNNFNPSSKGRTGTQTERYLTADEILTGSQKPITRTRLVETKTPSVRQPKNQKTLMQTVDQSKPAPRQSVEPVMGGRSKGKVMFVPPPEQVSGRLPLTSPSLKLSPTFKGATAGSLVAGLISSASVASATNQSVSPSLRFSQSNIISQSSKAGQDSILGTMSGQDSMQDRLSRTTQQTTQTTITPTRTTTLLTSPTYSPVGVPPPNGSGQRESKTPSIKSKLQAYKAAIKQKGKLKTIPSKPLTEKAALGLMMTTADNFTERSGKVRPVAGQPTKRQDLERLYDRLKGKFRQGKKDKSLFIEKTSFAIDSAGERAGIPYKAARLRRMGIIQPTKKKKKSKKIKFI